LAHDVSPGRSVRVWAEKSLLAELQAFTDMEVEMSANRIQNLNMALQAFGLDAAAFNPGPTLTYLTGLHFHLMERPVVLLVGKGVKPAIILPELEAGKARAAAVDLQIFTFGDNPNTCQEVYRQAGQACGLDGKTVGVEPARMRVLELRLLENSFPGAHFVSGQDAFASLRMIKDSTEIEAMRTAVHIAQTGLHNTIPLIRVGMSERELASELTMQLYRAGSDPELPFAPIIASGPNGADPHSVPGERKLSRGDLVVIDWGASHQGYFSDLTRTLALGEIDPELEKIAELTIAANAAGRAAIRPGLSIGSVDRAARDVIENGGYGQYFFHRVGHGLGLEEHEEPYAFAENPMKLEPGMTFTVEPGIYLAGKGGVRIEDDVVVTPTAGETLSDMDRSLIRIA
jgi:Xaa-Pro dipeptidase